MKTADLSKITKQEQFKTFKRHRSLLPYDELKELKLAYCDHRDPELIVKILNLNQETQDELEKIESFNFNVFTIREQTNENEMVTIFSHLMAKESLFEKLPLDTEKFLPLVKKLQSSY